MAQDPLKGTSPESRENGLRPLVCLEAHELQGDAYWNVDEVLREFIEGFRFLIPLKREVTFFGSARVPATDPWYGEARTLARMLTERGYTVITGGGPGIMEAANRGALEGCADKKDECSVGIDIILPSGERRNPYVRKRMAFDYFFTRKVMLSASAQAYVFFPGGFGTVDELTDIITLMQTKKMETLPVVCVGREFWSPFLEWMRRAMVGYNPPLVEQAHVQLINVVDSSAEALPFIERSQERKFF